MSVSLREGIRSQLEFIWANAHLSGKKPDALDSTPDEFIDEATDQILALIGKCGGRSEQEIFDIIYSLHFTNEDKPKIDIDKKGFYLNKSCQRKIAKALATPTFSGGEEKKYPKCYTCKHEGNLNNKTIVKKLNELIRHINKES